MDFHLIRDKTIYATLYETANGSQKQGSPKRLRSPNIYSQAARSNKMISAFKIDKDYRVPPKNEFTQSMYPTGSVDRLLAKPQHIFNSKKYDKNLMQRSNVSYNGDDTEQTTLNLPLVK